MKTETLDIMNRRIEFCYIWVGILTLKAFTITKKYKNRNSQTARLKVTKA